MSGVLSELAAGTMKGPRHALGADTISLDGGPEWECTRAETTTGRDFERGGQHVKKTARVVGNSADFLARYDQSVDVYLGVSAQLNTGSPMLVEDIEIGESFTTIELVGGDEAP